MRRIASFLIIALVAALLISSVRGQDVVDEPRTAGRAAIVFFDGDVNDYAIRVIEERFASARAADVDTVVFVIDTYGGLVDSALRISRFLKRQGDLHIIAYIPEKAISAGAMIAVACDEIVMEPGALIGNSGVVTGTGQDLSGTARAKAESIVLEEFRDSAARNDYPPELLEAMVIVERQVHWVENEEGERRFVDAETYKRLIEQGWRPVPDVRDPLDAADTLLTVAADLAVKVGIATEQAQNLDQLVASRNLQVVARFAPGFNDAVIAFLHSFQVRALLMTVLLFSLYMSFSTPGTGLPEVVALCALAVLMVVPLLTGYATWYEIAAVLVGIALIAVELFLIPGLGIMGIMGALLVLIGLTMTFVPPVRLPDMPAFTFPVGALRDGLLVVSGSLVASLLLWYWLSRFLPRMPYAGRLILQTVAGNVPSPGMHQPGEKAPMVGDAGVAVTDLRPSGSARFVGEAYPEGRVFPVISDSGFVGVGTEVKVRDVTGNRIVVRPVG